MGNGWFIESPLSLRACIGTMNLSNAVGARLCEPQRVATAPSPAGHRPALRDGRFMESPLSAFSACIGTMNRFVLVLVVLVLESKPPNRGRGRERRRGRKGGSWKERERCRVLGRVTMDQT